MASVFPSSVNGGIIVRDADGNPVPASNVENAYLPPSDFSVSCEFTMLENDCFTKIAPSQINAIVSELICFAATLTPEGEWDCGSLCNISTAFTTYMENFSSAAIGDQICGLPLGPGNEADPALVYCYDGNAFRLPLTGDDSLLNMYLDALCARPTEAADYPGAMMLFCGNNGIAKTSVHAIQLFRGEYVQAYAYTPNQMVRRFGVLWSPNAAIPGGTPFVVGTTGETWYEVSPSYAPVWFQALAYLKNQTILHNGQFYAANEDIPAGTAFSVSDTGATWRLIDATATKVFDHSETRPYLKDEVVTLNGMIYRARADMAAGAFDIAQWELIGGELNEYRGVWDQTKSYLPDNIVLRNNVFYAANDAVPVGAPFIVGTTGATWRRVGVDSTFEIQSSLTGGWDQNELLWIYPAIVNFSLPALLPNSRFVLQGGPLVDSTLSIQLNGVEVGQIVIAAGAVSVVFPTARNVVGGTDVLSLVAGDAATFTAFAANFAVERRQ